MHRKIKCILNNFRSIYNYNRKKIITDSPPTFLWIEPTNKCNLKCILCPNSILPNEKIGFMEFELFKKIIDESKSFVGSAFLFLGGESLLHKDIYKMINYAADGGIRPLLHTNATLLNKKIIDELLNSKLDYISFSMDGYTKDIYEKIRVNANFEQTINNIIEFLKTKKKMGKKKPYTVIQTLLTNYKNYKPDKISEKEFFGKFEGLPIDEINVRIPHSWGNTFAGNDRYVSKTLGKKFSPCSFLWSSLSVLYDGTVVPCCIDFRGSYPLGNVKNKKLLEIWNDKPIVDLRKSMIEKKYADLNPLCTNCIYIWEPALIGIPVGLAMIMGQSFMNILGSKTEKYFKRLAKFLQKSIWYTIKK